MSKQNSAVRRLDEYTRKHNLQPVIQGMLVALFKECPEDPYQFMVEYIQRVAQQRKTEAGCSIATGDHSQQPRVAGDDQAMSGQKAAEPDPECDPRAAQKG
mmetsp:Transcript_20211/g.44820  ORF Transcript_20211/g.44820 Transcript_20211/m.44820 type:complete len:101 (-) Transcript_20211:28-330(-)